jgi:Mg-chelatase subunit ChlD
MQVQAQRLLSTVLAVGALLAAGTSLGAGKPKPPPIIGEAIGTRPGARVDLVLVIDATGSMWSHLDAAKNEAVAVIEAFTKADPPADLHVGVVAYRDKGDADFRVAKLWELGADVEGAKKKIFKLEAHGGGDRPEDVNFALAVAIRDMDWDKDKNTARNVMLIGDAPPKVYTDEPSIGVLALEAKKKAIVLNTIALSKADDTAKAFKNIADLGGGSFLSVAPDPGVPGKVPPRPPPGERRDVVFVVDTTGSMGGTIETVRTKVHALAKSMSDGTGDSDLQESSEVYFGLIDYRDRGDSWIAKVASPLSADVGRFLAAVDLLEAGGGGDYPESVNKALMVGIDSISWHPEASKSMVLIGDAIPNIYADEPDTNTIAHRAKKKGIAINTVNCGGDDVATIWKSISSITGGDYYLLADIGKAIDSTVGGD